MADTPKLTMPEITASQSQKEVTHNDSLRILDALVQPTVIDKDLTSPPGSPSDGDTYIVGPSATGGWAGQDDNIAYYKSTAWLFLTPAVGWLVYVVDETSFYTFVGGSTGWASGPT